MARLGRLKRRQVLLFALYVLLITCVMDSAIPVKAASNQNSSQANYEEYVKEGEIHMLAAEIQTSAQPETEPPLGEQLQFDHYYIYFASQLIFSAQEISELIKAGTVEKTIIDRAQFLIYDLQTQDAAVYDSLLITVDTSAVKAKGNLHGYKVPVSMIIEHVNQTHYSHNFTMLISVVVVGEIDDTGSETPPPAPDQTDPPQGGGSTDDTPPDPEHPEPTDIDPSKGEDQPRKHDKGDHFPYARPDPSSGEGLPRGERTKLHTSKSFSRTALPEKLYMVLFPMTATLIMGFFISLIPDIIVLRWFERKKKERLST